MFINDSNKIIAGILFTSSKVAEVLNYVREFSEIFGHISMAEMRILCNITTSYKETKVGWTIDAMENLRIEKIADMYVIFMPEYNWRAVGYKSVSPYEKSQS